MDTISGSLSAAARERALAAMSAAPRLDILVVGGGVVGAGCALDAVSRGLTVGIVEARDWASGTSSRSSKLIHGGLRYLEMLDFGLVREALRERGLLLHRLAPHLVQPVSFLYPLRHRVWERCYVGAGVGLYDLMSRGGAGPALPHHQQLGRRAALRACPALRPGALTGAVRYHDAQVDDARLVTYLVRTAAAFGAHAASRLAVTGFLRAGERVTGVVAVDRERRQPYQIHARQVINATGVWMDDTHGLAGVRPPVRVRPAKGVHVVVARERIPSDTGLILRTATSVLFVIPWGEHWIVGTTDTPWPLDKDRPAASRRDLDYLLGEANRVLADPLRPGDIQAVYAGLRPLLSGPSHLTSRLSRRHAVFSPAPGLVTVAGGKYTTYRVMARDAVDVAAGALGRNTPPSCTDDLPILGAEGFAALWNQRHALARRAGLPPQRMEHLLHRYGTLALDVLDLVAAEPALGEPLDGYLAAEVAYAVEHEGALHLDDVLLRRTHIGIETPDRGVRAAGTVAALMGTRLRWTREQAAREVRRYESLVAAGHAAEQEPDDERALAAYLAAGTGAALASG
ncbi:MAG TPA: glycerol-3-phosphate dehydrogenase/oxidase [Rugosimonospora sp.]|nr:glycerol-3-phosphate dehydrogenase/oxidase [Rugosimonospora sp.]